jgi:tetratricopeptide (TPR) repeat protein
LDNPIILNPLKTNPSKPAWQYLLQESVLFIALVIMLLISGTNNRFVDMNLLLVSAIFLSVLGLAWVVSGQRGNTPLAWPILAWVVLYIPSIFLSIDPRRSSSQMILMSILIFAFIFASDLGARGWPTELIVKCILLSGVVVIALGWADYMVWLLKLRQASQGFDLIYRPPSANVEAMFLNILILFAASRLILSKNWASRIILGIYLLACLWLLFLTSSRGGWLGTAGGMICLVTIFIVKGKLNWKPVWQKLRSNPVLFAGLILLIFAGAAVVGYFLYKETLHPTHGPILISRNGFWGPAWQSFLRSPLFGTGPFTYAGAYLANHSIPPMVLFVHAQGTLMNILAERGITGLLVAGWLAVSLVVALWRKLPGADNQQFSVIVGVLAAITALLLHSIFDGFETEPLGLWVLAIAAGAALASPATGKKLIFLRRPYWVILILAAVWLDLWAISPLYQGVAQADSGEWLKAAQTFQVSIQRDPGSVIANQQLGLTESVLAGDGDQAALDRAISSLKTTISMEPGWAMNYANLGALYFVKKDLPAAQAEFEKSIKAAPGCAICYLNLGMVAETSNDPSTAQAAYYQVFSSQPDWVNAYFWRSTELRKEVQSNWLKDHPLTPDPTIEELQSEKTALSAYSVWYAQLAEDYLTAGDKTQAASLLKDADLAYFSGPADQSEVRWVEAELAASQGNFKDAVTMGQEAVNSYQMQGVLGPGSFGQLYYGPLMFRRPSMAMELVPQLQTITTPDLWGTRMAQLLSWYQKLGDIAQADQLKSELAVQIPDFKEK